jgi:hypothetical protein
VYPKPGGLLDSLRWEQMRNGLQDCECLWLLESKIAQFRASLAARVAAFIDRPPVGRHHAMHPTYSQAHGIRICHPSFENPLGGNWAADSAVGVGFSPWKTSLERPGQP